MQTFLAIANNNQLPNCPISQCNIIVAKDIFGPNGKTTQSTPAYVRTEHVNIPINVMSRYRHMKIAGDIMFVNTIPYFMTISCHIKFGTAKMTTSQKGKALLTAIKNVQTTYLKWGFKVTHILLGGQFEPLHGDW
jgi:hypothetical protein